MRKERDMHASRPRWPDANARRFPQTAWLIAATTAPAPWYVQVVAYAIMAVFLFFLLRLIYRVAVAGWRRITRRPAPLVLRWAQSPEGFRPEPHHWALATALVFSVRNDEPWDRLPLDEPVEEAREALRDAWGIHDRATLQAQLHSLLASGHRARLQPLARRFGPLSLEQFQREYAKAQRLPDSEDKRELLWQMRAARENRDGIRDVDFLAWDLVRYVWLCRHGAHLGYLDEAEARAMLLEPARLMQRQYRGWQDCAEQFLRARAFWAGGSPGMEASQEAIRRTIALLRRDRHSPWTLIDWNMPLDGQAPASG